MTVRDLITTSLRRLGVLAQGEDPTADQENDGLDTLNQLVDSWQTERLEIYSIVTTEWTIASGDGTYSVGSSGDIVVARPVFIETVKFKDTSPTVPIEYPLYKLTDREWADIKQKTLTSVFPTVWYYNPTYPTGTLELWPRPTSSTLKGELYAPQAVAEFASLDTTVALPPGYRRMLISNLAVELAADYERQVPETLGRTAMESKANVKRANIRARVLSIDAGMLGHQAANRFRWNIRTGE